MNLLEVIKSPTRAEQLMALPIGKLKHVPYSQLNSFRTAISRDIKDNYPEAEFETGFITVTEEDKPVKYGTIKRIK